MKIEYREITGDQAETRTVGDESAREIEAKVCSYGVGPDTFNTTWSKGWASDGLREAMPSVCWSHKPDSIIGSVRSYDDRDDGLYVRMQLADFDAVPEAKKAYSLIKDGHVRGWSFGFANAKAEPDPDHKGAMRFRSGTLYEVSPVLRASVPGTKTIAVRSADGDVTREISEETLAAMISTQVAEAVAGGTREVTVERAEDGTMTVESDRPKPEALDAESVRSILAEELAKLESLQHRRPVEEEITPEKALSGCLERAAAAAGDGDWESVRQEADAAALFADDLASSDDDPDDDGGRSAEPAHPEEGDRATVSNKPWSDFAQSDYSDAQWKAACLITGPTKADCKLPIREPDGTLNSNGVHAAAGRLGQTDASPADKTAAAKALMGAYSAMGEKPPPSLLGIASGKREAEELDQRLAGLVRR